MYVRTKNVGIIGASSGDAFSFQIMGDEVRERVEERTRTNRALDWERNTILIEGWSVIPYGDDNNLPNEIRDTLSRHNLAPRVFTKKKFLAWGNGPVLYQVDYTTGRPVIKYVDDPEIMQWLESWDYEEYLQRVIEDFNHTEGNFTKVHPTKGVRIGAPMVAKLEHIATKDSRLCFRSFNPLIRHKPTHCMVGLWDRITSVEFQTYPLFDRNSFARTSVMYNHIYAFGEEGYSIPDVIGSLPWIRRAIAIPNVLEALTNNSLHIRWHIISPQKYWDNIREKLQEQCLQNKEPYKEEMLEDIKDQVFENLEKVLAGADNVGKFWTSEKINEVVGNTLVEHKWELVPIEQKVKEFVEAQLLIAKQAQFETIAGLGLHQALANVGGSGKSDSGSEQLYAYKNHVLSEIALPELTITKAINTALKINFPNKNIKLGFYHPLPEREEDITSKSRVKDADI